MTVTRAVFYGPGVVRATKAEKHGGKGCRVFVHRSIAKPDVEAMTANVPILPTENECAPYELNYLHLNESILKPAADKDEMLAVNLKQLETSLPAPVPQAVAFQYAETWAFKSHAQAAWPERVLK